MKDKKTNHDVFKALALITQLGIGMLVPVVLCFFIGRWLDNLLNTGFFIIIFLILGILAAYRNLFVYTRPLLKGTKEREQEKFWRAWEKRGGEGEDRRRADRKEQKDEHKK